MRRGVQRSLPNGCPGELCRFGCLSHCTFGRVLPIKDNGSGFIESKSGHTFTQMENLNYYRMIICRIIYFTNPNYWVKILKVYLASLNYRYNFVLKYSGDYSYRNHKEYIIRLN